MKTEHELWYREAAQCWEEALPLGNGRLGAMVFGGVSSERIALNEDTLWSGYPQDRNRRGAARAYPAARDMALAGDLLGAQALIEREMQGGFTQSYLPLGDLLLDFGHADEAPTAYRRWLRLDEAVCGVEYACGGVNHRRECFVSAPDQAMYMMIEADAPGAVSFSCALTSQIRHFAWADANRLTMRGVCPSNVVPSYIDCDRPITYGRSDARKGMRFEAVCEVEAVGGTLHAQGGRLHVRGADRAVLRLCARTSFNGFDKHPFTDGLDERALCEVELSRATRDVRKARDRHAAEHFALYGRTELALEGGHPELPTDERLMRLHGGETDHGLFALLMHYGRYLLIASSRPGTQCANLQGIWNQHLRAPWSCNYTININAQMNYWPAERCNLPELHRPLFELIGDLLVTGARTADIHYGAGGAVAHHNTDIWRLSNAVGERYKGFAGCAFWPMGLGWLSAHLWEHYEYAPDPAFLKRRALPAFRACARFYLDVLAPDANGALTIAPATSPENAFRYRDETCKVAKSAQMTTSIAREVLSHYLQSLALLGIDEPMAAEARAALPMLPDYAVGSQGQMLEWEQEYDEPEPQHRHVSHLYGLFPGDAIAPGSKEADACRRSLERRGDDGTGWSLGWKINLWARLRDGEHALKLLTRQLKPVNPGAQMNMNDGGTYMNLFDAHPPFQIDGNFGACSGIAEMLLQSRPGEIELLPATPRAWSGHVRGLRAKGGATLDIAFQNGQLTAATIRLPKGAPRPTILHQGRPADALVEWA